MKSYETGVKVGAKRSRLPSAIVGREAFACLKIQGSFRQGGLGQTALVPVPAENKRGPQA